MPHSPCMHALHFRHRTRLRLAPDTMGETVDLTGVGRGVGFMVCGLVMGMVGRRTLSRAWSFSWKQKQRGKWCEMSELLHSAQIREPPISGSLAASSDNAAEQPRSLAALQTKEPLAPELSFLPPHAGRQKRGQKGLLNPKSIALLQQQPLF